MYSRKEKIEKLKIFAAMLKEQIQEKYPIKTIYDLFRLSSPGLDNRPKEVPLELWEDYIKVVNEMTTLMWEQWTEEQIKDFVDVKDINKIFGSRTQYGALDDYYNLGEINDTDL